MRTLAFLHENWELGEDLSRGGAQSNLEFKASSSPLVAHSLKRKSARCLRKKPRGHVH